MRGIINSAARFLVESAQTMPDNIAISDPTGSVSYEKLLSASYSVSDAIVGMGADRTRPIAIFLPRGISFAVSQSAVLLSGGFYAPLDYSEAGERLVSLLQNLDYSLIITDESGLDRLDSLGITDKIILYKKLLQGENTGAFNLMEVRDTDPACIMFTSGSTGTPKGVVVSHKGLVDFTLWYTQTLGMDESDIFSQLAPFHFDAAIIDYYCAVAVGAKLVIAPDLLLRNPDKLLDYLEKTAVTRMFIMPTMMMKIANAGLIEPGRLPDMRSIGFGAEVMPCRELQIWRRAMPDCSFANLYGPTETTVACTYYIADRDFDDSESLPIGVPCLNKQILVLKDDNTPAAAGEYGELCILGSGLSLGYWQNMELTQSVFVQNPLNTSYSELMYRTGDVVSVGDDGLIMFHGRTDEQVSIDGMRVELGDVENAARAVFGGVNVCAVFNDDSKKIILFIEAETAPAMRSITYDLRKHLPGYMLPSDVIAVKEFPVKASGKTDKRALKGLL